MFINGCNKIIFCDKMLLQCNFIQSLLQFYGFEVETDTVDSLMHKNKQYLLAFVAINNIDGVQKNRSDLPLLTIKESNQQTCQKVTALTWPLNKAHIENALFHAMAQQTFAQTNSQVLNDLLVGHSKAITQLKELIIKVANTDTTVLILGESGSGKEVVANALHQLSNRQKQPFVPVNCGAIPAELLESELFGHEKGAFTGAISARQGRFELAKGGTLFLDEIGDMPLAMQVKLLRVLQERVFERVGSNHSKVTDARLIAATHQDLENRIDENKFREDLYYRLNVFPIQMPALRQRPEDLPALINDLTLQLKNKNKAQVMLTDKAINTLQEYPWPGNIRELANLIERLVVLYPNQLVDEPALPEKYKKKQTTTTTPQAEQEALMQAYQADAFDLKNHLTHLERQYIEDALSSCNHIVAHAAKKLSLRRTTLVEKMRKYGLLAS